MELEQRAKAHGLTRSITINGFACWGRPSEANDSNAALVMLGNDNVWRWAPESWGYGRVTRLAPRFTAEAEALTAALAWLDAGEPEVTG